MPTDTSHLRRLADTLTGGTEAFVTERRPGKSWDRIAVDLHERFNLDISGETLRLWFGEDERRAS